MIPYHRPYPFNNQEIMKVTDKIHWCLSKGLLTNGEYVRKLEDKIKEMYNVEYCIATSSCTQGLLAAVSHELDAYIATTPSFTWVSLKYILKLSKYSPIWCDIDKATWLPNLPTYDHPVKIGLHTFGNVMTEKATIYDGSHALGCNLKNIGIATVFSLAPTKLITSCEGGLVITNNHELAEFVIEYRDKCARLSEIHAIIGLQTLTHLEEIMAWKKKVYDYYKENIDGIFQKIPYNSNYNTIGFLNVNNLKIPEHIETRQYYEPLKKGLPNTDYVYENIICLPSFVGVDYKKIVEDILEFNK